VFFSTFFLIFSLTYLVFLAFDMLPELKNPAIESESNVDTVIQVQTAQEINEIVETVSEAGSDPAPSVVETTPTQAILPVSLFIPKLNRSVSVLNPNSRNVIDLDAALLEGVVRHPDSAALAQEGTVFILGHSSYLPKVFNKNFQAFNGIQNLEWGDKIELLAAETTYIYRVEKVYRAKANDLTVAIAGTEKTLTLATCNSFGSTDDRYIVEAKLIETRNS